jgi:hypothetical protein
MAPFFVFWSEWTARRLFCCRLLRKRHYGERLKCLKRVFGKWEHGMLVVRRAVRWSEGKFTLWTLCLQKRAFDTWCYDTYSSLIKARALHHAFPRGTEISDAFAIEQALTNQVYKSRLFSPGAAWKMAVSAKSLAPFRNLHTMSRPCRMARMTKNALSPAVRAWANITRIFAYIRHQVCTMSIQAHAQFLQHVFDAWHLVRAHAHREWAIVSKCSAHRELRILSMALDDWSYKVQRRRIINRIQTQTMLKYFLLRGVVLNLWRKVVQQSALLQRKSSRMLARLHSWYQRFLPFSHDFPRILAFSIFLVFY